MDHTPRTLLYLMWLPVLFASCGQQPDLKKEKQMILGILQQDSVAHFNKDVDLFMAHFADSITSVYQGEVMVDPYDLTHDRFEQYFKNVTYTQWDNMMPPIIEISDDGSMAYAIIRKKIKYSISDPTGTSKVDSSIFAWVQIFEKQEKEWKTVCVASSEK